MATRRRRTREEEELEEIKRQRALSDWNQGNDPALRELSRAQALFTSRGNSAAKFAKNKGKVRAAKDAVENLEPDPNLPERAKKSFRKQQIEAGDAYDDFMRDADEFSGKPVGNYEPLVPSWKRREDEAEMQRAAAQKAADEKFEEAKKTKGAMSANNSSGEWGGWRDVDDVPLSRRERAVEGLGDNKDEELVQIETPSGGLISARGKNLQRNLGIADRADKDALARAEERQEKVAEYRRNLALKRLTDSGYDWKSEDSAALFDADGNLDVDKAKRAADRAEGLKAQATFDAWDYDKQLDRDAQALARNSRTRLRILRSAAREGTANAQELAEMEDLERMVSLGDNPDNRDTLSRAGFWRTEAEDRDRNRIAEVEKLRVLTESQQKQADAARKRAESVGRPLSDEELKSFGYPSWDDEAAWQELIQVNPAAAEIYKMRPVNVSRAGRAMSKALSAFA